MNNYELTLIVKQDLESRFDIFKESFDKSLSEMGFEIAHIDRSLALLGGMSGGEERRRYILILGDFFLIQHLTAHKGYYLTGAVGYFF